MKGFVYIYISHFLIFIYLFTYNMMNISIHCNHKTDLTAGSWMSQSQTADQPKHKHTSENLLQTTAFLTIT